MSIHKNNVIFLWNSINIQQVFLE